MDGDLTQHDTRRVEGAEAQLDQIESDNKILVTGITRLHIARCLLLLLLLVMAGLTVGEVAVLAKHQVKAGGSAVVVGASIGVVLAFLLPILLGRLCLLLGHLVLSLMVVLLLTSGQMLWFQLFMQLQIPMDKIQHVMAGYLLLKVTLITAILALTATTRRLTCQGQQLLVLPLRRLKITKSGKN